LLIVLDLGALFLAPPRDLIDTLIRFRGNFRMHVTRALCSVAAGIAAVAAAQPAFAAFADPYSYYSATNPLKAMQDGVSQAEMYGKFYVEQATYLRNNTTQRDPRPGGDAVFERTEYWFYLFDSTSNTTSWTHTATDQGPKTTSGSWYSQYDHNVIRPGADKGRMRTQVCEDHGILPDPCSLWPTWTTDL
jgi:hypothetical protein